MDRLTPSTWEELRKRVVYEDDDALALDKPAGISVLGDSAADDLLALVRAAGEDLRPVHRIDKVTSGIVLLAKSADAHAALTRQFNARSVEKSYLCIVRPGGLPERGEIDLPLATGRKNRVRVAGQRDAIRFDPDAGRWSLASDATGDAAFASTTRFQRLWEGDGVALLAVHPLTGRRHQIRVHLAWIGHPVVGDPLFRPKGEPPGRTLLHAWRLAFGAPGGNLRRVEVEAPPDAGFRAALPLTEAEFDAVLGHARSTP